MIRVGLLGAGHHSIVAHGPALKALAMDGGAEVNGSPHAGVELSAVCDIDEEKARCFAETFGFRAAYPSLAAMLEAETLDVLFLITPLPQTEKIVAAALPAGIPLLIEKPPGLHPGQTSRLLAIARETGTPHMVSFNRRFNPALRHAAQWIAADPETRSPATVTARMSREDRRETDFVIGTGIHLIDAVLSLLGQPEQIRTLAPPDNGDGDSFHTHLEFANGAAATILIDPVCGRHEEILEVCGTGFRLEVDLVQSRLRLFRDLKMVEEWSPPPTGDAALADVLTETRHLLDSLDQPVIRPDLHDGLVSMVTATAIQRGTSLAEIWALIGYGALPT